MEKKTAFTAIAALCVVATGNAAYLSYQAYEIMNGGGFGSFCDINSTVSCTNVLESPLSRVFGIPFPMIALAVYPVLLALALVGRTKDDAKFFKAIAVLSAMGTAFNSLIIYRETFQIKAFCLLCLMCTAIIVTILAISGRQARKACTASKNA